MRSGRRPADHHADYVLRRLEADVFPALGLAFADVTAPKLVALAKKIEARGALDIASGRSRRAGRSSLRDGPRHVERNPAAASARRVLKSRRKENSRESTPRSCPSCCARWRSTMVRPYTRAALQLIALTFVRTSRADRRAMGRVRPRRRGVADPGGADEDAVPHIVPLSTQAVDALRCLDEVRGLSHYVFPGERDHEKPMSNNTILKALERLDTSPNDWPRISRRRVDTPA